MKWFHNFKIATKLVSTFLIVALIASAVGWVGISNIQSIADSDNVMYQESTLGVQYATMAVATYNTLRYSVAELVLLRDRSKKDEYVGEIENYINAIDQNLSDYKEGIIHDEDRALYAAVEPLWNQYRSYSLEALEYVKQNQFDLVQSILLVEADEVGISLQDAINKLTDYNITAAQNRAASNKQLADQAVIIMLAAIGAAVAIAIFFGIYVSRVISVPIGILVNIGEKLADGEIDMNVSVTTRDEIGRLFKAYSRMIENTRSQAFAAERIADGDLNVDVLVRSEKDVLGKKLHELVERNNGVISNIAAAADQVAVGARQVSDSSMSLSQGATEQASSIEQLTASIEEISAQTKLNAENANQANMLAGTARDTAEQGNEQMKEMLKAMEDINASSTSISKIIKVIDDIAFQTNILALNAAVEAARAGQHGKGFAVVAEEVRNLAARSASAAKETTDMIENSIRKAEGGTKIANQAAQALGRIVTDVEKVAGLIGNIAVASNEQSMGIAQINQGVMQVSQVVQTNSATSEESAAASEELSGQAELLKEQVGRYKLKKDAHFAPKGEPEQLNPDVKRMLENMGRAM